MRLKEWLKIHKNDEFKSVMFERYERTYASKNGKTTIVRKLVNVFIESSNYKKFEDCDIVKLDDYETEAIDPFSLYTRKITRYCCWLDADQVKLVFQNRKG